MSPVKKKIIMVCFLMIGFFIVWGCGSSNSQSNFDVEASAHGPGWLPADHMAAARNDPNSCRSCHGEDLTGGISTVSCNSCHLGGPLAVHPATFDGIPWLQDSSAGHGRYVIANGAASCKNVWCHGANLQGVPQSGPACSTCHPGEAF